MPADAAPASSLALSSSDGTATVHPQRHPRVSECADAHQCFGVAWQWAASMGSWGHPRQAQLDAAGKTSSLGVHARGEGTSTTQTPINIHDIVE